MTELDGLRLLHVSVSNKSKSQCILKIPFNMYAEWLILYFFLSDFMK